MKESKLDIVKMFSTTQTVETRFKPSSVWLKISASRPPCMPPHTVRPESTESHHRVTASDHFDSAHHSDDRIRLSI